ncbi:MAG: hypothetical protein E6J91_50475 [Deltaproteobacteria bacterium]|nr:MAG: hypothetical protein E6J91_50475 [Deltaproteobacteria bacterium]
MSELWTTAREAVRALAAADPGLRRFGAAHHRYELLPPLSAAALASVEHRLGAALPDDLRDLATGLAAGGAGPGYGLVPIDLSVGLTAGLTAGLAAGLTAGLTAGLGGAVAAPPGVPWTRGLPLAHLGCGYTAVAALDGAARGEIWIDARAVGVVRPIQPTATALYLDWIDRLAHARWPELPIPPGACALAAALSGYLARCEAEHGVAAGALSGPALRDALSRLGPGAIEIAAASSPWFDDGDRVDPCIACARLIADLAGDGLRGDVVAPGAPPRPMRRPPPV